MLLYYGAVCTNQHDIAYEDLNPTILFFWKGRRIKPERCHCHDHVEMGYILSGSCKFRIDEKIYTVSAGDLLVFNPRVMHEGIVTDPENPSVEFFVAFTNAPGPGFKMLTRGCLLAMRMIS